MDEIEKAPIQSFPKIIGNNLERPHIDLCQNRNYFCFAPLKIIIIVSVVLLVFGCASNSGVFRTGDNIYRISTRATWELGGRAGAMRMALKSATKHCEAQGKV